jgi:hypothetical protein
VRDPRKEATRENQICDSPKERRDSQDAGVDGIVDICTCVCGGGIVDEACMAVCTFEVFDALVYGVRRRGGHCGRLDRGRGRRQLDVFPLGPIALRRNQRWSSCVRATRRGSCRSPGSYGRRKCIRTGPMVGWSSMRWKAQEMSSTCWRISAPGCGIRVFAIQIRCSIRANGRANVGFGFLRFGYG